MDKRERPRGFFEAFITVSGADNWQKDNKVGTNNNYRGLKDIAAEALLAWNLCAAAAPTHQLQQRPPTINPH
jgi:hypothetical protein